MASESIKAWLTILILASIGLSVVLMGGVFVASYHIALSDAEPVEATILHSEIKETSDPGGPRGESVNYVTNILYEYEHNGEVEQSSNVFAGYGPATFPGRQPTQAVADRFEPGETVTAYVGSLGRPFLIGSSLGLYITWTGMALAIYQLFGIDLPGRARLDYSYRY